MTIQRGQKAPANNYFKVVCSLAGGVGEMFPFSDLHRGSAEAALAQAQAYRDARTMFGIHAELSVWRATRYARGVREIGQPIEDCSLVYVDGDDTTGVRRPHRPRRVEQRLLGVNPQYDGFERVSTRPSVESRPVPSLRLVYSSDAVDAPATDAKFGALA